MILDPQTCYRALKARDPRFDGRFFVGVSSTGIYCRPICRVKTARRENCHFFPSAAAAEADGYRPCLRCRPEMAPGNAGVDAGHRIAQAAASLIEDGTMSETRIDAIAARLGVTDRHLRRVFQAEFGVSPVAFAQTQRLLLAKRMLTDTGSSATQVAFAAGFGSLRRFNALFKDRYRLSPKQLRKKPQPSSPPDAMHFELGFRPPYQWDALIAFLAARAISGVEAIEGGSYRRIASLSRDGREYAGWIEVRPADRKPALRVTVSSSLIKALPAVLARVKHLMDLSSNPDEIADTLGPLAAANPGLRLPGAFDGFEVAVRAIIGQQVSVAAARTLAGRLAALFGTAVDTPFPSLSRAFPSPHQVAALNVEDIARLGILPSRSRAIIELAKAVARGDLELTPGVNVPAMMDKLRAMPGIGEWTTNYIAMRALAWPDAFVHTDLGVMRAMRQKNPARILAAGETWRPWRAYAVMHLWASDANRSSPALHTINGRKSDEPAHRSNRIAARNDPAGLRRQSIARA